MVGEQSKQKIFYRDKPLFGLDIGHGSIKVMQINPADKSMRLDGYAAATFDRAAIEDGVIAKPEVVAQSLLQAFEHNQIGNITTRRVALAIPSYRTFSRAINLPKLKPKDLKQAIETEAERYVPLPLSELYLDYEIIGESNDSQDILVVAIPKKIADSYILLAKLTNLEPILIETTMHAAARIISENSDNTVPAMIIDFGSLSSDLGLCVKQKILVMSTVEGGGESFTSAIQGKLGVSYEAAGIIKNKYGLGHSKKQTEIIAALSPTLSPIIKEIHRMIRYYEERFSKEEAIGQVIILGGGANMPGLSDYLTSSLRLPVRTLDPWRFDSHGLQPPKREDKPMFSTVAGLAAVNPSEVFND